MPVLTTTPVWLDDRDVAWIDVTNTKVIEVARDIIARGWSPEEIRKRLRETGKLAEYNVRTLEGFAP